MSVDYLSRARDFLLHEQQFHLGFLPTEQANPLSASLEEDYLRDPAAGVRTLQRVDREVLKMAERVLASEQFRGLQQALTITLEQGGKVVFSGCGATGRLSILLESMWRRACRKYHCDKYANSVFSIMTGGDYALVKSVESFEDFQRFGAEQVVEMGMQAGDLLIAITEGGETSSVLGTVREAISRGAQAFILFNNPAELLVEHLERSRTVIRDPRVVVLDLFCGPMALAGSTRMQATTSEQLVAGAALESTLCRFLNLPVPDYAEDFRRLLDALERPDSVAAIAAYTQFEAETYRRKGKITYIADYFLLDIFTDTTERSPTFMLPPFRKNGDTQSVLSWAFVKHPFCSTPATWERLFCRPLRCLSWQPADYIRMNAGDRIVQNPPLISAAELLKFPIGNEPNPERFAGENDYAVLLTFAAEKIEYTASARVKTLSLAAADGDFSLPALPVCGGSSPLRLMDHLAVKLTLNTISTGTMVLLGRVSGNWMSWVDLSNKKLLDRGIRLIAQLGRLEYAAACELLFKTMAEVEARTKPGQERPPVVKVALQSLQQNR
ncbi:MAG: sugar phosphate isomerase [Oligosphaeraceae bacterium]|nr:sugar phosphate isomerase [Oligosphaeraceae bacterium]